MILTGPNMAGKSTAMRQVALAVILAQAGGFVPAKSAHIGVVDRVFTRVGASDNLSRGQSTFMVEMRETAALLRGATSRSLVVLDEIGRGTSTYDGLAIAWAVAEHLVDEVRCRALFATHYHELCALEEQRRGRVANFNVSARERDGDVLAGEGAELVGQQGGPGSERFVEAADEGLEVVEEADVELELAVVGAEELGDAAGDRALLEAGALGAEVVVDELELAQARGRLLQQDGECPGRQAVAPQVQDLEVGVGGVAGQLLRRGQAEALA